MRFLAFHAGIYVRLCFSTDVLIFCDYPRLSTFLSLLFHISVKAQLNWKLSPRSYENKTKSIWPGVKFSCLQLSLFLHHLSPYSLLPFHFISNLRGLSLPCFFLLTTCLFTNVLAICLFPLILSWFPFHLPALCSPWDEQPDMQLVPGQKFGINMIFLLTRKNREQFLNWKRVILLLKPQGKRNLGISRENHFDFARNNSLQPSLEKILGRSPYY